MSGEENSVKESIDVSSSPTLKKLEVKQAAAEVEDEVPSSSEEVNGEISEDNGLSDCSVNASPNANAGDASKEMDLLVPVSGEIGDDNVEKDRPSFSADEENNVNSCSYENQNNEFEGIVTDKNQVMEKAAPVSDGINQDEEMCDKDVTCHGDLNSSLNECVKDTNNAQDQHVHCQEEKKQEKSEIRTDMEVVRHLDEIGEVEDKFSNNDFITLPCENIQSNTDLYSKSSEASNGNKASTTEEIKCNEPMTNYEQTASVALLNPSNIIVESPIPNAPIIVDIPNDEKFIAADNEDTENNQDQTSVISCSSIHSEKEIVNSSCNQNMISQVEDKDICNVQIGDMNGSSLVDNERTEENGSILDEKEFESDNDQRTRNLVNSKNRIDTNNMIEKDACSTGSTQSGDTNTGNNDVNEAAASESSVFNQEEKLKSDEDKDVIDEKKTNADDQVLIKKETLGTALKAKFQINKPLTWNFRKSNSSDESSQQEESKKDEKAASSSTNTTTEVIFETAQNDEQTKNVSIPEAHSDVDNERLELLESENNLLKAKLESALEQIQSMEKVASDSDETVNQLQDKLTTQMTSRAETENKLKSSIVREEKLKSDLESLQDEFETFKTLSAEEKKELESKANSMSEENKRMAFELTKVRKNIETLEMSSTSLTSRLNEAKKIETVKIREATRYAEKAAKLEEELNAVMNKNSNQQSLQKGTAEKLKALEETLNKERQLNVTRKTKMKSYADQKSTELKLMKETNSRLSQEVDVWRKEKYELTERNNILETELAEKSIKVDEIEKACVALRADLSQIQRESNSRLQENEELKKKRQTAKYETLNLLRSLEAEKTISSRLKHEIKYTLLPKALSQQELLSESLHTLQGDLEFLTRTKFSAQAAMDENMSSQKSGNGIGAYENDDIDSNSDAPKNSGKTEAKLEKRPEYIRLIDDLETESKKVSMGILALTTNVDKLHEMTMYDMQYASNGEKTCASVLADILIGSSSRQIFGPSAGNGYANVQAQGT